MNKKIIKLLLLLSLIISPVFQNCNHQHDENCGLNPVTEEGCHHVHDDNCEDSSYELHICFPDTDRC